MDMVMSIASAGLAMHTSRMMTDVNMALMGKALDLAEAQGEAVQEMMELSSPPASMYWMYTHREPHCKPEENFY